MSKKLISKKFGSSCETKLYNTKERSYLYFIGMPFEDPNDFPIAIGILNETIENYPFEQFGWKKTNYTPYLGMGAEPKTGARTAVPVKKLAK